MRDEESKGRRRLSLSGIPKARLSERRVPEVEIVADEGLLARSGLFWPPRISFATLKNVEEGEFVHGFSALL